jgi:RES domain-containing protein
MKANTAALYTIAVEPLSGKLYRYILTKYASQPLSMHGAETNGGRYNVAGLFGALYLAFDRKTCEAEVSQGIAAGVPFKRGAFTAWDYEVSLQGVIRLDRKNVQDAIEVTEAEITIPGNHWTASAIGEHLHKRADVEGLVAPSAQSLGDNSLAIYIDKVRHPSHIAPQSKLRTWPL